MIRPATRSIQHFLRGTLISHSKVLTGARERIRTTSAGAPGWTVIVAVILAIVLMPIVTIFAIALTPAENIWPHLFRTILPDVVVQTLLLASGVAFVAITVGTASAWLVTMYRFPGRAVLDQILVIPLAMPTYIVAYCYVEILDYSGPLQVFVRSTFGWTRPTDYWFPEIRSLGGAVLVMGFVLYPYVYLTARASFVQQSVCALEVARTLGRTAMGSFWSVALPLARPAIAAGAVLVLMESLNDLGAVQYLGVQTFSASIYATWLQRSNLAGAAQLSSVLLVFITLVLVFERIARRGAQIHHTTGRYRAIPFQDITGWQGYAAAALASLPFVFGFLIPMLVLARHAAGHVPAALDGEFLAAAWGSFSLAALSAVVAVAVALILSYARRISNNLVVRTAVRSAGLAYAVPGTVLAIGLLFPLAGLDNWISSATRATFAISAGQLFSGTLFAVSLAYVIRFLAIAMANVEAGLERVSPNLDAAARTLGETGLSAFWHVHVPLLLPAIGSAALLVFVDAMKELPATLLLRPFNFETLATHVYNLVALEQFETAALGALSIVLVGIIPILLLHRAVAGGRAGHRSSGS